MCMRIFVALVILVALGVGIFALILRHDQLVHLIAFRDFFEAILPILAFGALIKYLCTCPSCCSCQCSSKTTVCSDKRG